MRISHRLAGLSLAALPLVPQGLSAKTQSGWQSRVHFGQKINLTISLFFMDGLQVQYLFITSLKYLGAFASGFRDMP